MSISSRQFRFVGVSHHDSPLDLREKLSFSELTSKQFLKSLNEVLGIVEGMVLSTCNRTEVYYADDRDRTEDIIKLMMVAKGLDAVEVEKYFKNKVGLDAVRHAFRVSLGLEARVLGDLQIINQVKNAYQWAADENMAGPFLHRLMHTIFYANKRVVQETAFRDGAGSVASVAVSLIRAQSSVISNPRILLVGTGEIGQNVLENLGEDYDDITILNRTRGRAEQIATGTDHRVADFENLNEEVNKADVVILAVASDTPLISQADVAPSLTLKLIIDLGVPRVVDEAVEKVQGVLLYNIDQIEEKAGETLENRKRELQDVERIVDENIREFGQWSEEMAVSPTIKLLKETLEKIRQEEIARHLKGLSDREVELLHKVTKGMIQKVIKLPVLELKAACKRGEEETLVGVLNDIFNLEKSAQKSS